MILRWAIKDLLRERGSLLASVGGIGATLLLVIVVEGMFAGESERIVAYIKNAGADVWVMQSGVSNVHMASSLMRGRLEDDVKAVPGVVSTTPILYLSAYLEIGRDKWFSYIVGLPSTAERGGPWSMVEGRDHPGPGEAIIPDIVATKARTGLGGTVTVLGHRLTVVGISSGTYSMANSVTFLSYPDVEDLLSAPGAASYLLVTGDAGVPPAVLAGRIRDTVHQLNAMSRDELIESDRGMAMQMGVDIIRIMTWVGSLVAVLIVAFTSYTSTVRRKRELGVVKALGMTNRTLYAAVLVQTFAISVAGYLLALALAHSGRPIIQSMMPEVALLYPASTTVRLAIVTVAIAFAAALVPARRIARLDPALVFQQ
jgi:putative ABC transport system permease protein